MLVFFGPVVIGSLGQWLQMLFLLVQLLMGPIVFFIQNSLYLLQNISQCVVMLIPQHQEFWTLGKLLPCLLKQKNKYCGFLSWLSDVMVYVINVVKTRPVGPEQRRPKPPSACKRHTMGQSNTADKFLHCPQLICTFLIEELFI